MVTLAEAQLRFPIEKAPKTSIKVIIINRLGADTLVKEIRGLSR